MAADLLARLMTDCMEKRADFPKPGRLRGRKIRTISIPHSWTPKRIFTSRCERLAFARRSWRAVWDARNRRSTGSSISRIQPAWSTSRQPSALSANGSSPRFKRGLSFSLTYISHAKARGVLSQCAGKTSRPAGQVKACPTTGRAHAILESWLIAGQAKALPHPRWPSSKVAPPSPRASARGCFLKTSRSAFRMASAWA